MVQELNPKDTLGEAQRILASEEDKNFEIEISSQLLVTSVGFLNIEEGRLEAYGDYDEHFNGALVTNLINRLRSVTPDGSFEDELPVKFRINYREVDFIGRSMLAGESDAASWFIQLDEAFVEAGGKDNEELRVKFAELWEGSAR